MFIFISFLLIFTTLGHTFSQYDVSERIDKFDESHKETSDYDVTHWLEELHLQQCAVVEIGEGFCAIFVELRDITSNLRDSRVVREYFLGLCSCATIRTWRLCSDELTWQRESDCIFTEANPYSNSSARVHRRLCDLTLLRESAPPCDCGDSIAGERLFATQGFPTCFAKPLPESLCYPRGVCGIARCSTLTTNGIHSPRCEPDCYLRQPFCEEIGSASSAPAEIHSVWSDWSAARCNATCGEGVLLAVSTCRDQVTGNPAIDCLGPGSSCCPESLSKCYCEVSILEGVMRASRFTGACTSAEGCAPADSRTFTFQGALPPNGIDSDQLYDSGDRERFEGIGPTRRLLRAWYPYISQSLPVGRRLTKNTAVHDFYEGRRLEDDDQDDYGDDQAEDEHDENEEDANANDEAEDQFSQEADDDEAEDEDDGNEETMGAGRQARARRSPRKHRRVPSYDYEASFEGKPEVDEPGEGEECEDASTEPPPQYYDYDASASAGSTCHCDSQVKLAFIMNLLIGAKATSYLNKMID